MFRSVVIALFVSLVFTNSSWCQVDSVPARTEDNLIVAAFNIQWVGQKFHDYDKLAEVIQHFDVCGVIEVKREKALPDIEKRLETLTGKEWSHAYGVRTHQPPSTYHEAYGVLWRTDRVEVAGLIGNLWDYEDVFRNDPFVASFRRKNFDFSMILIHTQWDGGSTEKRKEEIVGLANQINWMQGFLDERDIIACGDFNYKGDHLHMKPMADDAGMIQLDADPKSTFKADNTDFASSYEHMYVLEDETSEFVPGSCDTLNTPKLIYGSNSVANNKKAKKLLSDHLPIFAVFKVDGEDDD